jgi:hypothetical protein
MTLLRRFLVVQLLMLWQGGFLFYAAFVVPTGTDVLGGKFAQARITRFVAGDLNWIGVAAIAVFVWDLLQSVSGRRRWLWGSVIVMGATLAALFAIRSHLLEVVDFSAPTFQDDGHFRFWHRTYLWMCTVQWAAGLVYAFTLLDSWRRVEQMTGEQRESIT